MIFQKGQLRAMLSTAPPQTSFFGDAFASEEMKKRGLFAEGNMPVRGLKFFSWQLTPLGAKLCGKDKAKSYTEFLDVLAEMSVSFSDTSQENLKSFFLHNGVDTRCDGVFEMYIVDPQLRCDYIIQCLTEDAEQIARVLAYAKEDPGVRWKRHC